MNTELLGMSNEELIQWAHKHSVLTETSLRKFLPDIELYCAQHPISVQVFVEKLVVMSNMGIRAALAVKQLKEYYANSSR